MPPVKNVFEGVGYSVLSVSRNRLGEYVVRTDRGEFNITRGVYPPELSEEELREINKITRQKRIY